MLLSEPAVFNTTGGIYFLEIKEDSIKGKGRANFCQEKEQCLFIKPTGSAVQPEEKLCRHKARPLMRNHLLGKRVYMSNV